MTNQETLFLKDRLIFRGIKFAECYLKLIQSQLSKDLIYKISLEPMFLFCRRQEQVHYAFCGKTLKMTMVFTIQLAMSWML